MVSLFALQFPVTKVVFILYFVVILYLPLSCHLFVTWLCSPILCYCLIIFVCLYPVISSFVASLVVHYCYFTSDSCCPVSCLFSFLTVCWHWLWITLVWCYPPVFWRPLWTLITIVGFALIKLTLSLHTWVLPLTANEQLVWGLGRCIHYCVLCT